MTRALMYSRTAGFRHADTEGCAAALVAAGASRGLELVHTEEPSALHALDAFDAVVFFNTSGEVVDEIGQKAVEAFGGGLAVIHGGAASGYEWPWYGEQLGAYFVSHPPMCEATVEVDCVHPSTAHLPEQFMWTDEWYRFDREPTGVRVLATVDSERTGAEPGGRAPLVWCRDRVWYTALGHPLHAFSDERYLTHCVEGIRSVCS